MPRQGSESNLYRKTVVTHSNLVEVDLVEEDSEVVVVVGEVVVDLVLTIIERNLTRKRKVMML